MLLLYPQSLSLNHESTLPTLVMVRHSTVMLAACLVLHYQAYCMSTLTRRLAIYLFSHSHLGSLPVYSLALTQARCQSILSLSGLLPVYSHRHYQAYCLSILLCSLRLAAYLLLPIYSHSHSGSLPVYSHSIRLTAYESILTLTQARCLSILTPSGSLPVYSHSHSVSLPIYSHSIRLTAYLFSLSLRLGACIFSHYQAHSLSILTLMLLSICFHTQCC